MPYTSTGLGWARRVSPQVTTNHLLTSVSLPPPLVSRLPLPALHISPPESREYIESYPVQEVSTRIPTRLRSIFSEETLKREAYQRERLRRGLFGEKHRLQSPGAQVNGTLQHSTRGLHVHEVHDSQKKSVHKIFDYAQPTDTARHDDSSVPVAVAQGASEHRRRESPRSSVR